MVEGTHTYIHTWPPQLVLHHGAHSEALVNGDTQTGVGTPGWPQTHSLKTHVHISPRVRKHVGHLKPSQEFCLSSSC
jgi:hypothetical protein